MWLHMGSFGPKRVVTTDGQHDEGAPYKIVDNEYSLLDVSDVVFIDAPGTGFSRIMGKDKEKAFWGVDQDAHAFDRFIRRFLTKYRPVELAEVFVWGELWDAADCGASAVLRECGSERDRSAVADSELR